MRMVIHCKWSQMNFSLLLVPPLMFLPPLCSHIKQKTQFENPVMEAKKKLSAETLTGAPGPAATPAGNCTRSRDLWSRNSWYIVIWNTPMTYVYQKTFSRSPQLKHLSESEDSQKEKKMRLWVKWLISLGCLFIIYHLGSLPPRD